MEDRSFAQYTSNIIVKNIFSEANSEGSRYNIISKITDHTKDNSAVKQLDGCVQSKNGNNKPRMITCRRKLLIKMNDRPEKCVPLKYLKEHNPLQLAEYAIANNIVDKPAFKWWVPTAIKKRNCLISKVKTRYWQTTYKCGIMLPQTMKEALHIDDANDNAFWTDVIKLGIIKVRPPFRKWEYGDLNDALGEKKVNRIPKNYVPPFLRY